MQWLYLHHYVFFFSGRLAQSYTFDFFNYAGIDRPVHIYTTPKTYVDDMTVLTTSIQGNVGKLSTEYFFEVALAEMLRKIKQLVF